MSAPPVNRCLPIYTWQRVSESMPMSPKCKIREFSWLGGEMNEADDKAGVGSSDLQHERVPFMQRLLDNHFLLLFLGVVLPTVLYIVWGIMELVGIPLAPK